jgi:hypothetical protein
MRRVVVLGRGGAGKSVFSGALSATSGLPTFELDAYFWRSELTPLSSEEWVDEQSQLVSAPVWIMDGDLGPYDELAPRLRAADTIFILDFPLWRCAWRSLRRGRERADYWRWLITYRRRCLPVVRREINAHAPNAEVHVMRRPREVRRELTAVRSSRDDWAGGCSPLGGRVYRP